MKWHWNEAELVEFWTLSLAELSLLSNRTGYGRLGFAILLKFFQLNGCFPSSLKAIPTIVLPYLSEQTDVPLWEMEQYNWNGRTAKRQCAEILSFLGVSRFRGVEREAFLQWLRTDLLPQSPSLIQLQEQAGNWFRERNVEPLSPTCSGSSSQIPREMPD